MKRFSILILSVLLFAGCNNMLTNPDAFNVEEASISMDISRLIARVAGEGDVITSTLEFVGEEPKHAPFEKTQTINGSTVNYTIKGIPSGSSVQFKMSVFKNDILVFEGLSEKITIKGKNNLKIGLNKNSVWISYFDSTRKTLAVFDANFSNVNNDTLNSCFEIPYEYEGEIYYSVNIQKQCMDENENIYLLSYNYDLKRYSLYRCAPPYKDPVCLVESIDYYGNDPLPILYDSATDFLIVVLPGSKYRTITNASTSGKIDNFNDGDPSDLISDFKINPSNYSPADMSAVYNNEFYWIKTDIPSFPKYYILYKSGLEEGLVLYKYDNQLEDDEKFSGVLINNMKSAIYDGEFTALITDLVINKEGLFCLISDSRGMGYNKYSSSRGAVVQINHDLTDVSLYGWTDHAYIMNGIKQNANNETETVQLCKQYTAKSLQEGFYGPQKIVGLKPKKLIFLDNGGWAYLDKDGLPTDKMEGHVIIFDLETHSFNGDFRILGSSFSRDFDRYANTNGYTSFTKTWQ